MAESQDVHQRPEAQPLGALGDGRQEHAGHAGHAERRRVMLGDMISVEAAAVVDLRKLEPAFIELGEAGAATVDVIEYSEFHGFVPLLQRCAGAYLPLASGSWASIRMKAILQTAFDRLTQA